MSKDKALVFDLSSSISYGRLSLRGKVLWPMLLIKSDAQGRGQAETDWIKWRVCPNVEELTIDDIGNVLDEMASERVGLLHLYEDRRGRKLYQIIRWWEPEIGTGSNLQFARPSEYRAPENWTDRVRIQHGKAGPHERENWDQPGGFAIAEPVPGAPKSSGLPASTPPKEPPSTPPIGTKELKGTELNPKETKSPASAGPDGPSTFADWQSLLEPEGGNRPAILRSMHLSLYPGRDPPSFGYIGKVARKVGGAGRLAELLWQNSTRPPTGDVLAYVQGIAKGKKHGTDSDGRISIQGHHPTAATPEELYGSDG